MLLPNSTRVATTASGNEEIEKSADILQKNASNKCNAEIQKAQNYYNGYQQGIEDLLKCIRRN